MPLCNENLKAASKAIQVAIHLLETVPDLHHKYVDAAGEIHGLLVLANDSIGMLIDARAAARDQSHEW